MPKQSIEHIDVASKRVLMRVDFNVPLSDNESGPRDVTDDLRIRQSLPSIQNVLDRGGKLILISHLGRPDGKGHEPAYTLKPAADRLRELLSDRTVHFIGEDCLGDAARQAVEQLGDGEVLVLENLRFHKGEKSGDAGFAGKLAAYGDVYCNEAFGTAHRADASMVALPKAMSGKPCVAGLLLQKELKYLSDAINNPAQPFVAVLGGAKVSDKLGAIANLMGKVDTILIGGAMAYTFLRALDQNMGRSLMQVGLLEKARDIIDDAAASNTDLILPHDHICGKEISHQTPVEVFEDAIPDGWMGLDIGQMTVDVFTERINDARTIVWNGPMGAFEVKPFDVGTKMIAESIARATDRGATTIVGGGDTAAAVHGFGWDDRYSHVSTGGGACLEMLEGKRFESVDLLDDA